MRGTDPNSFLKIISLLQKLAYLDDNLPIELSLDLILLSLPSHDINTLDPHVEEVVQMLKSRKSSAPKKEGEQARR